MERYLFFNSSQNDVRQYQAGDFAWYFGNVLKSGLIHTDGVPELQVKCQGTDLRTYVEAGKAIIQGHAYENTSNLYLEHALPEATMDRIDRIVLRLDKRNQSRFIKLFVLQGEPSASPVAPTLQRDEFIHELSLAQIRVRANTSALNPADLVDERLDEVLCGLVSIQNTGFVPWADYNSAIDNLNTAVSQKANDNEVIPLSQKGTNNGVATLGSNGKLPTSQLPDTAVSGSYSGNGAQNRNISLGFRPKMVIIIGGRAWTGHGTDISTLTMVDGDSVLISGTSSISKVTPSCYIYSAGFYINYNSTQGYMNDSTSTYHYIAIR